MTPRGFLVGVRELGFDDVSEMEAACLLKVLAKPELDGSVILNEFILIMENFGIPALTDEDEYENDYIPDSDLRLYSILAWFQIVCKCAQRNILLMATSIMTHLT